MGYDVITDVEHLAMKEDVATGVPKQHYKHMIDLFYHIEYTQWPNMWESGKAAYRWNSAHEERINAQDKRITGSVIKQLKEG